MKVIVDAKKLEGIVADLLAGSVYTYVEKPVIIGKTGSVYVKVTVFKDDHVPFEPIKIAMEIV